MTDKETFLFQEIPYKITGYSIISFDTDDPDYLNRIDEILDNSKFYTKTYGRSYLDYSSAILNLIPEWANKFYANRYPDFLFISLPNMIGTYICKKHYDN